MPITSNQTESYNCVCDRCGHTAVITGGPDKVNEAGWRRAYVQTTGVVPMNEMSILCAGCVTGWTAWMKSAPAAKAT